MKNQSLNKIIATSNKFVILADICRELGIIDTYSSSIYIYSDDFYRIEGSFYCKGANEQMKFCADSSVTVNDEMLEEELKKCQQLVGFMSDAIDHEMNVLKDKIAQYDDIILSIKA